jgi:hypothetical protein
MTQFHNERKLYARADFGEQKLTGASAARNWPYGKDLFTLEIALQSS